MVLEVGRVVDHSRLGETPVYSLKNGFKKFDYRVDKFFRGCWFKFVLKLASDLIDFLCKTKIVTKTTQLFLDRDIGTKSSGISILHLGDV